MPVQEKTIPVSNTNTQIHKIQKHKQDIKRLHHNRDRAVGGGAACPPHQSKRKQFQEMYLTSCNTYFHTFQEIMIWSYMIHNKRSIIMAFMFLKIKWNPSNIGPVWIWLQSNLSHQARTFQNATHPPYKRIHKVPVWLRANIGTVFRDPYMSPSGVFPTALL